jgi:hypothetical protein
VLFDFYVLPYKYKHFFSFNRIPAMWEWVAKNHYRLSNHILCPVQGKKGLKRENNATLKCWHCVRMAPLMSMPIPSIIIQSCQKVRVHFEHSIFYLKKIIEKRASLRDANELMPAANPPQIYHTDDNIQWRFLQTLTDYGQLQTFRQKNHCTIRGGRQTHWRLRLPCQRRYTHNCEFQLLALKTTSGGYHVYTFGAHNHAAIKSKSK